jgi:hypothetical protein
MQLLLDVSALSGACTNKHVLESLFVTSARPSCERGWCLSVAEVGRTDYVTDDALLHRTTFHVSARVLLAPRGSDDSYG